MGLVVNNRVYSLLIKLAGIQASVNTARTVLRVDNVVMEDSSRLWSGESFTPRGDPSNSCNENTNTDGCAGVVHIAGVDWVYGGEVEGYGGKGEI